MLSLLPLILLFKLLHAEEEVDVPLPEPSPEDIELAEAAFNKIDFTKVFPIVDVLTESIEHVLNQDVSLGHDTAISAQRDAKGTRVGYLKIPKDSKDDKDKLCTQACQANKDCTFWIRATNGEGCWLQKDWRGNSGSFYRRVGFMDNHKRECGLVDRFIKKLNNATIPDSKLVWNMELSVPLKKDIVSAEGLDKKREADTKTKCMLQLEGQYINVNLEDFEIMAKGDLDLRSVDKHLSGIFGDFTAFIKSDIQVAIEAVKGKWKVMATDFIPQELHVGINAGAKGDLWHWVTGHAYSAMKFERTCDDLLTAYAALTVAGKNHKTIYTEQVFQNDANKECCDACMAEPMCDGFSVDRQLGGWGRFEDKIVRRKCWLKTNRKYSKTRHGGWKGNSTVLEFAEFDTKRVGYFDFPRGLTQSQVDLKCQAYCEESAPCEMWLTSTNQKNPGCWLARGSRLDDGMIQNILHKVIQGQLTKALNQGMQALVKILDKEHPPKIEAPVAEGEMHELLREINSQAQMI